MVADEDADFSNPLAVAQDMCVLLDEVCDRLDMNAATGDFGEHAQRLDQAKGLLQRVALNVPQAILALTKDDYERVIVRLAGHAQLIGVQGRA